MKEKEKQSKTKGGKFLKPIAFAGLSLAMACSLTACGKDKSGNKDPEVPAIIWTADNAYTQAKAEGFTGTFEEFLATLAGITKVETDSTGHLKVTLSDGSVVDAGKVTGEKGEKGDKGNDGSNGQDGISITSIVKTSSNGLVDTYTITLSNGQTQTFTVTNGRDGQNGVNGINGNDGEKGEKGDKGDKGDDGEKGDKGDDGVSITSVTSTSDRWGLITTTIYNYSDGNSDTITTNNGVQFGRLYDIKTEEELNYLLSKGVTNFAFLNNIALSNSITLNETEKAIYKNIIPFGSSEAENYYFNYNFNLNGYTLSIPSGTTVTVDENSTVLLENGNLATYDDFLVLNNSNGIMITNDVNLQYIIEANDISSDVKTAADLIIQEINSKAYNNKTKLGANTVYSLSELNEALGEDAISNLYVEYDDVSLDNYNMLVVDGDTYLNGQEVELSIGNANYIKDRAYYIENGKLYVNAVILATASAETEPYTIASVTAPAGMNVTETDEKNVYNVEITSGTKKLFIEINGAEKDDLFLRKKTSNGVTSFGFTATEQIPGTERFSYGIYPLGWCEDLSVYAGAEFTVEYDLYIIGKGTVHLTINYSVSQV